MKKTKVYGGYFFLKGNQVRGIIAGTKKQVSEVTGLSLHYINNYWSETGNDVEVETALSEPGTLFYVKIDEKGYTKYTGEQLPRKRG